MNENLWQQMTKCTNNGGGNACVRSFRPQGKSIGIPTGEHGGWLSLDESTGYGMTAGGAIDLAIAEIVDQVVRHQDRYDRFFYCVNGHDADTDKADWIGNGIFHIGDPVREYITQKIRTLPDAIHDKLRANRRAIR